MLAPIELVEEYLQSFPKNRLKGFIVGGEDVTVASMEEHLTDMINSPSSTDEEKRKAGVLLEKLEDWADSL